MLQMVEAGSEERCKHRAGGDRMLLIEDAGMLALSLALVFEAAATGARYRPDAWYEGLVKSRVTPPRIVFPVVWGALYILMAVAAWLVWRRAGFEGAWIALLLYLLQLACNALWSWLFFGRHQSGAALMDIVVLWVLLVATVAAFSPHSTLAALLMLPYLLWVTLALYLNVAIVHLN